MKQLSTGGQYEITPAMKEQLSLFYGNFATQAETADKIRREFLSDGYVIDPHTAVAAAVYEKYKKETGDGSKALIVSTASPYKFIRSVVPAIVTEDLPEDDFALIDRLEAVSGVKQPQAVRQIRNAPILHDKVADKDTDSMKQAVKDFLGL